MKIYIDGKFFSEEEAKISVFDHGLLYGDGIFEGLRFYNGALFCLEEHIDRLYQSAQAILLKIPLTHTQLQQAVIETVHRNDLSDGYVRLIVTRGKGSLGLNPESCPQASIIIIVAKIKLYPQESYEKGLHVITCSTRRVTHGAFSPMVKSLNYLNNVMAKIEAAQAGAGEGLMLNEQGLVAECTGDNIFVVKHGEVFTPPTSSGALAGITRAVVIKMARAFDLIVHEKEMTRYDIYTGDECFLTGTAAEIIPVASLDQRVIGDGNPGKITQQLMSEFQKVIRKKLKG
ncbi:MAG: branched-chain-amino-acid transaminase [Chthoniobacterales bacterium]